MTGIATCRCVDDQRANYRASKDMTRSETFLLSRQPNKLRGYVRKLKHFDIWEERQTMNVTKSKKKSFENFAIIRKSL